MAAPERRREIETTLQTNSQAGSQAWDLAELRIIYERAPIGLYSLDREFRFVRVNEYLARLNNRPIAEHVGRNIREVMPGLADSLEPLYRKVLETGRPIFDVRIEWASPAEPTEMREKVSSYYPVEAEDGSIIGVTGVVRDVTEMARVERALHEREERYRLLFEKANDGLFVFHVDADGTPGKFQEANETACRMLGYTRDELLQMSPDDFRDTSIPDRNFFLRQALQKGQVVFEREIRTKTGARMPAEISATAFDLRGKPAILSVVRDITEHKEKEEELRQLSTRLLQSQDEERRRIARELHDSFAQRVLAVNLNLALLEQNAGALDERAKRALAETREIMDSFAKEIRSLSYVLHPPVLDELGLASAIEETASGFSERSGIHMEVEIQPETERLPQDVEVALFRIVQQALANVQRHSGSPTVKIRLAQNDGRLVLEIADRGQWKIRKPEKGSKAEPERLGVGIPGMRERIRQLGGNLEIKSGASGTTVRAVLPLNQGNGVNNGNSHRR